MNLKFVLGSMNTVRNVRLELRSSIFIIGAVRKMVKREVRKWILQFGRAGGSLCLTLRMTAASAPSILKLMNNTEAFARMKECEMK